jgi:hypothetical protein
VSVTEPLTHGVPPAARTRPGWGARLDARFEAMATRENATRALIALGFLGLAVFLIRPTFPNYDTYYDLVWGKAIASGHLPDYNVLRTPTPHPLAEVYAAFLSLFGGAADRIFVLTTIACFLGLLVVIFRFTQHLLGTLIGSVAVLIVLTRTDLEFYAMRAVVDIPFLLMIFSAALIELKRPRAGMPVLALLGLAGLLRPEAWVFSGAYVLWLYPKVGWPGIVRYAAVAAIAPLLWLISDWIVTGHPLHSLTSTRDVAGQFGRNRSVPSAIGQIPNYIGANERYVNVVVGGLGCLLAIYLLRRRAALAAALMAIGLFTFLAIAAAGLSVIPRYLVVPSLLFNVGVGVALFGWTIVKEPRARRVAIGVAIVSFLIVAWRVPGWVNDFRKLHGQTLFVKKQHQYLKSVLEDPAVVPLLQSCRPITVPTHSAIPVIEYETGLSRKDLQATIAQARPPSQGLLLTDITFNFEPAAARSVTGISAASAQKWWSNYPLSAFSFVASNPFWRVYANCG